jgi:hypothetical protein
LSCIRRQVRVNNTTANMEFVLCLQVCCNLMKFLKKLV